jgi:hypothetical protein
LHADGDVDSLSEHEALLLVVVGDIEVGAQGDDPLLHQHLHHLVRLVQHDHELGKSWSAKNGVVRHVEVSNQEVDIVNAEVLGGAELYW